MTVKVTSTTAVREPVKNMLGAGTDAEFEKSLPESTASTPELFSEQPTKRKRRSKEEMAASRGDSSAEPSSDPLMSDPRYARAVSNMTGLGGKQLIGATFKMTGKPLVKDEETDVEDFFYVMSKKGGIDPTKSWFVMAIYAVLLLCRLVAVRTDIGEQIKKLFEAPQPKKEEKKEGEQIA